MAHFVELQTTELDPRGLPFLPTETEWINLDQVTSIRRLVVFGATGDDRAESAAFAYFAMLEVAVSSGEVRVAPLGMWPNHVEASAAIDLCVDALTCASAVDALDLEIRELLGD